MKNHVNRVDDQRGFSLFNSAPARAKHQQQAKTMIANSPYTSRPMFLSPEEWLEHYESCRAAGHRPWEPALPDELLLAESSGLLALHPEWIPCVIGLRLLGLPEWFGRRQKPLSQLWQEKFVQTLIDNPNTVAAIRVILQGGPTDGCN